MNRISLRSLLPAFALFLLSLTIGCSPEMGGDVEAIPEAQTAAKAVPAKVPAPKPSASPSPQIDYLSKANNAAQGAIALTQSAVSGDDWNTVAAQWQRAIKILKAVPSSNPNKAIAQEKIVQYERNLANAQQKAAKKTAQPQSSTPTVSKTATATTAPKVPKMSIAEPREKTTASASPKVALARHLNSIGSKFYGTYWCGACKHQKKLFGEDALQYIQEVECDPRGKNPQTALCKQAGVRAYPTWEINGRLYRGSRSLEELAEISKYSGDRNFN